MNTQKELSHEQQYMLDQVIATMRIENMEPTQECIDSLQQVALGEKTIRRHFNELKMRYQK